MSYRALIYEKNAIQKKDDFLKTYGTYFPTLPIPLVIDKTHFDELCHASKILLNIQTKIIKLLLSKYSEFEILEIFNLPEEITPFVDWDELQAGENIIGRFDIIPSIDGYQFCEINADPAVNGLKLFDCYQEFSRALGCSLNKSYSSPRKDVAEYLRQLVLKHKYEYVVIFSIDWYIEEGTGTVKSLFDIVRETIPEAKVLLVDDNNYPDFLLNPDIGKKTIIYRIAIYQDIKSQILLSDIFNSGATVINNFETEIRSNKVWFAIFHDKKYHNLLTEYDKIVIQKYIPPTFYLNAHNFQDFINNKDIFVFKKNRSYGGLGVLMGSEYTKQQLEEKITHLNEWTAQNLINADQISIPSDDNFISAAHNIVLGLFFLKEKFSGMLVRANTKSSVVNVTYGGAKMGWAYPMTKYESETYIKHLETIKERKVCVLAD